MCKFKQFCGGFMKRFIIISVFCALSCACSMKPNKQEQCDQSDLTIEYPCNISEDLETYQLDDVDYVVKDEIYDAMINDLYINFDDYEGKLCTIEGFYIDLDGRNYVGKQGNVCPYCNGGFVSFEFYTDNLDPNLISEKSWIRVTGVLRKGKQYQGGSYLSDVYFIELLDLHVYFYELNSG